MANPNLYSIYGIAVHAASAWSGENGTVASATPARTGSACHVKVVEEFLVFTIWGTNSPTNTDGIFIYTGS